MKRTFVLLAFVVLGAACCAVADYGVEDRGTWPQSWPKELEPLRKQARTLEGSLANIVFYEIPFAKREEFEAAWPHLLKLKSKEVPLYLVRSPDTTFGKFNAGVRIKCPPRDAGKPENELTNIQLIVDGNVVDLNRIPLPKDTAIIDERFKDERKNYDKKEKKQ